MLQNWHQMSCLHFSIRQEYEYPSVLLGVFVKKNESNLDKFITQIANLNYPPNKIQVFLYKEVNFRSSVATTITSIKPNLQDELLTNIGEKYLQHYSDFKTVYQVSEETAKEMAV